MATDTINQMLSDSIHSALEMLRKRRAKSPNLAGVYEVTLPSRAATTADRRDYRTRRNVVLAPSDPARLPPKFRSSNFRRCIEWLCHQECGFVDTQDGRSTPECGESADHKVTPPPVIGREAVDDGIGREREKE